MLCATKMIEYLMDKSYKIYLKCNITALPGDRRSVKCSIAIVSCPSVRPSVCDAGDLWSYILGYFESNYTDN